MLPKVRLLRGGGFKSDLGGTNNYNRFMSGKNHPIHSFRNIQPNTAIKRPADRGRGHQTDHQWSQNQWKERELEPAQIRQKSIQRC